MSVPRDRICTTSGDGMVGVARAVTPPAIEQVKLLLVYEDEIKPCAEGNRITGSKVTDLWASD